MVRRFRGTGTILLGFLVGLVALVLTGCPSPVTPIDSATRSFDLEPPADPSIIAPAQPTYETTGLIWAWAGGGGGDDVYRHRINGQDWNTVRGVTSFTPEEELLPGRYLFEVQERDAAGNWSASRQADTTIRVREPEVRIFNGQPSASPAIQTNTPDAGDGPSEPSDPAFLNANEPGADWNMPIDQYGLSGTYNVRLQRRQNDGWETLTEIADTELTQWRPENALEDGSYRLGIAAISQGGAVSLRTPGIFVIDTAPPGSPTVSGPAVVSDASAGPTAFTATPVDDDTVSGFEWELYDTAPSLVSSGTAASAVFPVALSSASGGPGLGSYELRVRQVDAAGNVGVPAVRAVVVENIPSVVLAGTTTNPTNDATPSFTVTGNTTGGSGSSDLANVFQWVIDGTPVTPTFSGPGAMETPFDEPLPTQSDGTYAIAVRQQRNDGSWTASSAAVSITIDTTPPAQLTGVTSADLQGTAPDQYVTTQTPQFTFGAGEEAGVTIEFTTDGGINWSEAGTAPLGSFTLPSLTVANDYEIAFRQVDAAGNVGTSSTAITVDVVDSGSSTITITNPGVPTFSISPTDFTLDVGGDTGVQDRVITIDTIETITAYQWLINGSLEGIGTSFTVSAGTAAPAAPVTFGANTLTLIVTIGGQQYSDDFFFTVVDN
ncbi:MAG: Ig-like domain-containing protein [Alkalispirochaeta sp.]